MADKEQALVLAAQFGKNLIEEKEDLEKQIESMKREQQTQIEVGFVCIFFVNLMEKCLICLFFLKIIKDS